MAGRFSAELDDPIRPIPDRPEYRAALSTGVLVPRVLVTGVRDSDGDVTLISEGPTVRQAVVRSWD
jgi:hypothetical protein